MTTRPRSRGSRRGARGGFRHERGDASLSHCAVAQSGHPDLRRRSRAYHRPRAGRPGSLEEFLTERHWGYNGERGKDTLEYRVDHPRWTIWHAENVHVDYNAETLCGLELAPQLKTPISALIAGGSAVSIHWRNRIAE